MAILEVREYFKKFDMEDKIRELDVSSATVQLAAQALGCSEARIAKTLSFRLGDGCLLIVTAGDTKIDNAKFKGEFHTKAKFLTPDEVIEMIGHSVGGVCPFAIKDGVPVYLDKSLERFDTVFPACGSSNSAIELTIPELERVSGYSAWVDVCKIIEAETNEE